MRESEPASDVSIAMELGCDGVLLNTGIAGAQDPLRMAEAMKLATKAGRLAYQAGRIPKKLYATALQSGNWHDHRSSRLICRKSESNPKTKQPAPSL